MHATRHRTSFLSWRKNYLTLPPHSAFLAGELFPNIPSLVAADSPDRPPYHDYIVIFTITNSQQKIQTPLGRGGKG